MSDTPRHILLIDDDELQFRLARAHFRMFRGEQFVLDWEPTFEGGLQRLLERRHCACLLDFQLGERDGLELIREAIARGCHTPIIFLTADESPRVDIDAMNSGALDFLVKGELTPAGLERSVRYALKLGETLGALHRLATRDELTGLANRREFYRLLGLELERARGAGQDLALIVADVDRFKAVNDGHGHGAGDAVLREVARRFKDAVRSVDAVGRPGGDEFALLLVGTGRPAAVATAERLRAAVSAEPVQVADQALPITVSLGVAVFPEDASGGDGLFAVADRALYAGKQAGRDRVGRLAPP